MGFRIRNGCSTFARTRAFARFLPFCSSSTKFLYLTLRHDGADPLSLCAVLESLRNRVQNFLKLLRGKWECGRLILLEGGQAGHTVKPGGVVAETQESTEPRLELLTSGGSGPVFGQAFQGDFRERTAWTSERKKHRAVAALAR